jgi:hydrogenase maturation protease
MENCSLHESAGSDASLRTVVVGLGNPLHGDDAVGLIVAQSVFELLRHQLTIDFLDCPVPDARLAENLIGYQRAVILDAFIDTQAEVGTVKRVEIARHSDNPTLSLHTTGFRIILALAQMVGVAVPRQIQIYGIVVRQPEDFRQGLSRELCGKIPKIVQAIASEELRRVRRLDRVKCLRVPRALRAEEFADTVKVLPSPCTS